MLISTAGLEEMLDDPDVIIADTRSFQEYSEGHIPGSVHLDLFAFHWMDTSERGIGEFDRQAKGLLSILGVTSEKRVVFYDSVSGMLAARGVWMAMYLSHDALMLDGGISKWQREGRRMETATNAPRPTAFSGDADPGIICGFEHIMESLDSLTILDARSPAEYDGSTVRAARPGHIPNAVNIDWSRNLKEDGTFKTGEELSKLYGFAKDAPIVTYCQGAYRAANSFLALRMLGFENVRVYLGSWGEWGNRTDLPVEK